MKYFQYRGNCNKTRNRVLVGSGSSQNQRATYSPIRCEVATIKGRPWSKVSIIIHVDVEFHVMQVLTC